MYKRIVMLMVALSTMSGFAQTITTAALPNSSYCAVTSNTSLTYTITGTFNAGNIFTAQLSDASGSFAAPTSIGSISSTSSGIITITFPNVSGSGYRVRVVSSNPVITGSDNGADITLVSTPGNPAVFGSNVWNAYCYSDNNFVNYVGYYTENTLSFDSRNTWTSTTSPSTAPGYQGCEIANDNHSVTYKREGFECGLYKIDLPGHDDHVTILKDGLQIFQHNGCCDAHSNIFTGFLTPTTTIEVRWREFGGNSYSALTITKIPFPTVPQEVHICPGSSASITASMADSYTWSPAASLNTTSGATVIATPATTTTYKIVGTNTATGCLDSNTYTVFVEVPINLTLTPGERFCQTATQTLSTSGAYSYSWSPATNLNTTTGTTVTATGLTSTTTYTVTGDNNCTQESLSTTITVDNPVGDPNNFGANTWNIYCFGATNFTNYKGYYVDGSLSFDTRNQWGITSNPSVVGGYQGCQMSNDNFSLRFKRQGFPCNYYRLDLLGNDDGMELYIDGVLQYSRAYNNSTATGIWTGFLGASSTVEFRLIEGGGNAYAAMNFVPIAIDGMSPAPLICSGTSTTLSAPTGSYTYNWAPAASLNQTNTASVVASPTTTTTYTVTITDITTSCAVNNSITVTVNPTPVMTVTPTSGGYCTTGSVTFTASGANSYTWSPATDLNTTTGNTVIASPTSTTTYTVTGNNNCASASVSATVSVGLGGIDDNLFGNNKWTAYCYSDNNFSSIAGSYEINALNFDSRDQWASNSNPTTAPGYIGCAIANDNFSVRFKRKGFTCGIYALSIPAHDDHVFLYINGALVYSHIGCCDAHNNVYYAYLDANTTVELAFKELTGGAYAALSFATATPVTTTWTGNSSTDWHTAANWNNGVPSPGKNAVIANTTRKPTISSQAACFSLTINSGAILTISGSNRLDVFGNWTNNGTFTANLSSVNFIHQCAAAGNTISSSNPQTFYGLSVTSNLGASINSGVTNILNNLFVSTSFATNDNLKLISNGSGTGSIDSLGAGVTFTGNVTVERMLSGTEGYRLIGSPISNATFEQWDDDFLTSGFTGSNYPTFGFNNIYSYNEPTPGAFDFGFVGVTNITNTIVPGMGYYAYIYPNLPYPSPLFPLTIDVTGTINRGDFNFNVSYTDDPGASNTLSDGWNILANPYPSAIDWSKNCWTKTNIDDAFYIWDKTLNGGNGDMRSFVNGVGDATQYINSSQGFIVHANAASPVLTATEGCKSNSGINFLRVAEPENVLTLVLKNIQTGFEDNLFLQANNEATNLFDAEKDAMYLAPFNPSIPSLYSKNTDTTKYSIQSFPLDSNITIPIFINTNSGGTHSLKFDFSSKSNLFRCVTLTDHLLGINRDILNDTSTYNFTTNAVSNEQRFSVSFYRAFETNAESPTCHNSIDGSITINLFNASPKNIEILNSNGTVVFNQNNYINSTLLLQDLSADIYTISIVDNSVLCSGSTLNVQLENPNQLHAEFFPTTNPVNLALGNQNIQFNTVANSLAHTTQWRINGDLFSTLEVASYSFQDTGIYAISRTVSTQNCVASDTLMMTVINVNDANTVTENSKTALNNYNVYTINHDIIITNNSEAKSQKITILDLLGKTIYSNNESILNGNSSHIKLNVSNGVYLIVIEDEKSTFSQQISFIQ